MPDTATRTARDLEYFNPRQEHEVDYLVRWFEQNHGVARAATVNLMHEVYKHDVPRQGYTHDEIRAKIELLLSTIED